MILDHTIRPPHLAFPLPAFGDDSLATADYGRVEGDKAVDFSAIGGSAPEHAEVTEKAPPIETKTEIVTTDTPPPEKVVEKKEETKPAKVEEKPEKKAEKKVEPKVEEKKVEKKEEKPRKKVPADDTDLDALTVKPNAPEPIQNAIRVLKSEVKDARAEVREHLKELETLRTQVAEFQSGKAGVPEAVTKELETLREANKKYQHERFALTAGNDPEFVQEWTDKRTKAETNLFDYLKSMELKDEVIEIIKKAGIENYQEWNEMRSLLSPVDQRKFDKLFDAVLDVEEQRAAEVARLKADGEGWRKDREKKDADERLSWGRKMEDEVKRLANNNHQWTLYKEITEGMTPEQKAEAEAHNKGIDELGKRYSEEMVKLYGREHTAMADHLFRSFQLERVQRESENQIKELTSELEAAKKRADDLESTLSEIRSSGKTTHVETTKAKPEEKEPADASEAIRAYKWGSKRS